MNKQLGELQILPLVQAALREDIRSGDVTTDALIPQNAQATAHLNFREGGVLCGLKLAQAAIEELDRFADIALLAVDGERVAAGATVLRATGSARALLSAERVALNFLQRMSGIATQTAQFVDAVSGTGARIIDTRKTTPGWRLLEKYAVRCGGGSNHRFALDDLILIKDNHIALCGDIATAVRRAREYSGHAVKVEVECDTLQQVEEAVASRADIILLDNMTVEELKQAVQLLAGRALAEASGGVTLQSVRAIAQSGVDLISVGALTHSVRALDIGMEIEIAK